MDEVLPRPLVPQASAPSTVREIETPPKLPMDPATLPGSLVEISNSEAAVKNKKKKDAPINLEWSPLPPAEEIFKSIPAEGITIEKLVEKFSRTIDESNVRLFNSLLKALCVFNSKIRVAPVSQMPAEKQITNIFKEARELAPPMPILEPHVLRQVPSKLLDPMEVTFSEPDEIIRGASNILPRNMYRVFYKDSATLCCYVTKDTHAKHRDLPHLKLREDNASQALGKRKVQDLTKARIERHLVWNQKKDPSSFISAFNNFHDAWRRAEFHHDISRRIGQRISCARISTSGLVPATVRAQVKEAIKTTTMNRDGPQREISTQNREVHIPIWVRDTSVLADRTTISLQELIDSGAEVWLSITEIRMCDLRVPASRGHSYEWIAWGKVHKSNVQNVMPFDGKKSHNEETSKIMYSINSRNPWVFDWKTSIWVLDADKKDLARSKANDRRNDTTGNPTRKRTLAGSNNGERQDHTGKRQKTRETHEEPKGVDMKHEDCCQRASRSGLLNGLKTTYSSAQSIPPLRRHNLGSRTPFTCQQTVTRSQYWPAAFIY